jgi:predicted deacylase
MSDRDFFSPDYFTARAAFRACARAATGESLSCTIRAVGPRGESLSIDGTYIDGASPRRLVVITSGIHGVEGYAGSALQQLWLSEFAERRPAETSFLLVHALNPFGFAHGRRVNEHNVDLNRNALASFPGPANPSYRALNAWLNPASPVPRVDDFLWPGLPLLWRHGRAALTQAVAGGQYEFPEGLFYGGAAREESLAVLTSWLEQARFADAEQVWHFDLHTGLGKYGQYQLLLEEPVGSSAFAEWVRGFGACVKSDHPSDKTHYSAHGVLQALTQRVLTKARVMAATVEFGTLRPAAMLRILRAENRLHHHGAVSAKHAGRVRAAMVEAFAPRDPAWRKAVIAGGREIFTRLQAVLG